MSLLECKDLAYRYQGKHNQLIFQHVNMTFEEGKFYVIVGVSGAGKTTLLALLAGLAEPVHGAILFHQENIKKKGLSYHRRHHVSMVFQNYNLIDYMTPYENICLVKKQPDVAKLSLFGLDDQLAHRNVLQLSGGQQQRVAIARALYSDAPILLADEPTGNLDRETAEDILAILQKSAHTYNKCVIVVTHSKQVTKAADHILRLKQGVLYEVT